MKQDELTQPAWGDTADNIHEGETKYGTTNFKIPTVVQLQTADNAASSGALTFGESMETLNSIPGKSQILRLTSHLGSSRMRLASEKPQTRKYTSSLPPDVVADSSPIEKS